MGVTVTTDFIAANAKGTVIQGPLVEILSTPVAPGCRAYPSDVTGTFLEMGADGLWTGASVGTLTREQADALAASGVMGKVKTGTRATVGATDLKWGGAAVGWEANGPCYLSDTTGAIDMSEELQRIIDDASIYATGMQPRIKILLPPGKILLSNIIIKRNVLISGELGSYVYLAAGTGAAAISINGNGIIRDVSIHAWGANCSSCICIDGTAWHAQVVNIAIDGAQGVGVLDKGLASIIDNVLAINCVLSADEIADYTGAIELRGADGWVYRCESSTRGALGMSESEKSVALLVSGANYMINDFIAETSDHGVLLLPGASQTKMNGCRGELCYGHGWLILGGSGRISDASALRNSKHENFAHNEWHVDIGATSAFTISALVCESSDSGNRANFAIFDGNYSASSYNSYVNPSCILANNPAFVTDSSGTSFSFPETRLNSTQLTGESPYVFGYTNARLANSQPTNVVSFSKSTPGQKLLVKGDGHSTLIHDPTKIALKNAINVLMAQNTYKTFIIDNGVAVEI